MASEGCTPKSECNQRSNIGKDADDWDSGVIK